MERSIIRALLTLSGLALALVTPCAGAGTSMESVVNATLVSNPKILSARANERAVEATVTQARSGYFPTVSLFALGGREWSKSPAVAGRLVGDDDITLNREEYRVSVEQLLFAGGRVYGSVKQSLYNVHTAQHQVDDERQTVALQAIEVFLDVLRNRELIALAKKNVKTHEEIQRKIAKRVKGGADRRVDDDLAAARLYQAKTRLERFDGDLAAAEARYLAVTLLSPVDDLELPQAPVGLLPATEDEAVDYGAHHNPKVLGGHSNVLSTRAAVTVARSNFFPTITGRLSASDGDNLDGIEGPPRNQDAMASVEMNYDFFSGFRDVGAVREAQEKVKEATHNVETFQLDVSANIKTAWANYQVSMEQVILYQKYVMSSQKVVDDYKKLFILGERQLFNVLDAENENFAARVSLVNARYDNLLSMYRIFTAMGNLTDVLFKS